MKRRWKLIVFPLDNDRPRETRHATLADAKHAAEGFFGEGQRPSLAEALSARRSSAWLYRADKPLALDWQADGHDLIGYGFDLDTYAIVRPV